MNFIDKFMLDDDLSTFELISSDINEISLGIILGNIDKIQKVSPSFITDLKKNQNIDPACKAILLKKVFSSIEKNINEVSDKNKQAQSMLINEFICATKVLQDILHELKVFKDKLKKVYKELFSKILSKFIVNDRIIFVAISSYSFKDELSLECSLFCLDIQELSKLSESNFLEDPLDLLKLFTKCFKIVQENKFPPGDVFSIISFNRFYEYINLCLQRNITLDYSEILSVLSRYRGNFTPKQLLRFRDSYYEMLAKQKVTKNSNFEKLYACDAFPKEPDYVLNKIKSSSYSMGMSRNNIRSRPYRADLNRFELLREPENQNQYYEQDEINSDIEIFIISIIEASIEEIDHGFLNELLTEFIITSSEAVTNSILKIFNNHRYSQASQYPHWKFIIDTLGNIPEYSKLSYHELAFIILSKYPNYI